MDEILRVGEIAFIEVGLVRYAGANAPYKMVIGLQAYKNGDRAMEVPLQQWSSDRRFL